MSARPEALLARIRAIFPGRYDNSTQRASEIASAAERPHGYLAADIDPVTGGAFGDCAFLVRGYGAPAAPPYMARVYGFRSWEARSRIGVRLSIHDFDGDRSIVAGELDSALLNELEPSRGIHHDGRDLAVIGRAGAILCTTVGDSGIKAAGGVDEVIEHYSLAFNARLMHIRRASFTRSGLRVAGRGDDLPYRLVRV